MFKKIIIPKEELQFRQDGFDNKYLINEGSRAIGLFAISKSQEIPAQISAQDVCFFIIEGNIEVMLDDKNFNMKEGELLLVPKQTAYTVKMIEDTKILTVRM